MRLLVDISGLLWRSAYSSRGLADSTGRGTNVLYGTLRALESLALENRATELVIIFDGGSDRRKEIYPEYKGNRKKDPEVVAEVNEQIEYLKDFFDAMPVIQLRVDGVEADDIFGILVPFLKHEKVCIVSSDSDLLQLVRSDKHKMIAFDSLPESSKYSPAQIIAEKVLVGDPSDNIKGVMGLGPVKFEALIERHKSLKRIVSFARKFGLKLGRMTVQEAIPIIQRNLKLIRLDGTFVTAEEKKQILDQYRTQRKSLRLKKSTLKNLFREFEFKSFLNGFDVFCGAFKPMVTGKQKRQSAPDVPTDLRAKTKAELAQLQLSLATNADKLTPAKKTEEPVLRKSAKELISYIRETGGDWVFEETPDIVMQIINTHRKILEDNSFVPFDSTVNTLSIVWKRAKARVRDA